MVALVLSQCYSVASEKCCEPFQKDRVFRFTTGGIYFVSNFHPSTAATGQDIYGVFAPPLCLDNGVLSPWGLLLSLSRSRRSVSLCMGAGSPGRVPAYIGLARCSALRLFVRGQHVRQGKEEYTCGSHSHRPQRRRCSGEERSEVGRSVYGALPGFSLSAALGKVSINQCS